MEESAGTWSLTIEDDASQAFGTAVDDDDVIVAGGPSYSYNGASNGGIAYVYEWSGSDWAGAATLTPDDVEGQDEFGLSVGVDDDVIIVGSHKDDDAGMDSGSAYIFRKNGEAWIQEANLVPADSVLEGRLGFSVDISGDYAVMGGPFELQGTTIAGSAYIFEYADTAWVETIRLVSDQPSIAEGFGWDVAINGDVAMIGANGADGVMPISGAVYVYNRIDGTWTFAQKLAAIDGSSSGQFGASVDVEDDCAVIGAFNDNKAYVYLFDGSVWREEATLTPAIGEEAGGYGIDVDVSNGNVIVGTLSINVEGVSGGGAFLYSNLCEQVATSNESEDPFNLSFELQQNYPNPFAKTTTIQYNVLKPANVQLSVYNLLGQEVARLKEGGHSIGTHIVTWDAAELASGMYIYALDIDGVRVASKRMVIR